MQPSPLHDNAITFQDRERDFSLPPSCQAVAVSADAQRERVGEKLRKYGRNNFIDDVEDDAGGISQTRRMNAESLCVMR